MANIKSAAKRAQITRIRTARNAAYKSMMKTAIRRFETAVNGDNAEEKKASLYNAIKIIDKMVSKGIVHKNTAARKKSRLTRIFNNVAS